MRKLLAVGGFWRRVGLCWLRSILQQLPPVPSRLSSKGCCSTLLGAPPIQGRGRLFLNVEPGETDPPKVVDTCCCQPNLSILPKDPLKIVDLVPAQDASRQRREVFQEDTVQGKVSFVGCHLSLVSLQTNTLGKITLCGQCHQLGWFEWNCTRNIESKIKIQQSLISWFPEIFYLNSDVQFCENKRQWGIGQI